jgi:insertion element IS1 protein InsB
MLDHGNSQLLGWVCGDRSAETGEQIIPQHCGGITAIYADDYPGYPQIAGTIPLVVGKRHTVPIERNNGYQRRWLASFHRRTMVVTRSLAMLEARMKLFARYRINGSIQELTALLRQPSPAQHPLSILK